MKITFRTDANHHIGMGHVMRCLSIADAFCKLNNTVLFILADSTVSALIKERGYETIILHTDYRKMESELDVIKDYRCDLFIVDSYYVTNTYLGKLRKVLRKEGDKNGKLVYIDDICSFPYPADILVNYNAYASSLEYHKLYSLCDEEIPELILGTEYVPLRSMFCGLEKKVQPKVVQDILISTGGADELHLTLGMIRFLHEAYIDNSSVIPDDKKDLAREKRFHFVLGALNSDKKAIYDLIQTQDNIVCHENVIDMKSLIQSCDIAISAAGSTLYEICACGIPLITFALADNQIMGAEAFERLGLADGVGDLRNLHCLNKTKGSSGSLRSDAMQILYTALLAMIEDVTKREKMGKKMQELIDGHGAERIVKKLTDLVSKT